MNPKDAREYMKIELAKSLLKNELFLEMVDEWNSLQYSRWLNEQDDQKRKELWLETKALNKFLNLIERIAISDQIPSSEAIHAYR